jgi:hypothetical protein
MIPEILYVEKGLPAPSGQKGNLKSRMVDSI